MSIGQYDQYVCIVAPININKARLFQQKKARRQAEVKPAQIKPAPAKQKLKKQTIEAVLLPVAPSAPPAKPPSKAIDLLADRLFPDGV